MSTEATEASEDRFRRREINIKAARDRAHAELARSFTITGEFQHVYLYGRNHVNRFVAEMKVIEDKYDKDMAEIEKSRKVSVLFQKKVRKVSKPVPFKFPNISPHTESIGPPLINKEGIKECLKKKR